MKVEDFVAITKDLCGFPSFFNAPFFRRIVAASGAPAETPTTEGGDPAETDGAPQRITKEAFQSFWDRELAPYDSVERFFRAVRCALGDARGCAFGLMKRGDLNR